MVLFLHRKRYNYVSYASFFSLNIFITRLQDGMKKITIKSSKIKEKICDTCGLRKTCGDLPGFCVLLYYVPIALVVAGLVYLLITMSL